MLANYTTGDLLFFDSLPHKVHHRARRRSAAFFSHPLFSLPLPVLLLPSCQMYRYARCPSCRINHRDGPKHVFKATHKKKLQTILDKAAAKLIALRVRQCLDSPLLRPTSKGAERSYWCWFCEEEIDNSANQFYWYLLLR